MAKIKVMEIQDEQGNWLQIFPITHADAVVGLKTFQDEVREDYYTKEEIEEILKNYQPTIEGGVVVSTTEVINTTAIVDTATNSVSLTGLKSVVENDDFLVVHYNSTHLIEGIDYNLSSDRSKIVKVSGYWNESNTAGCTFSFDLFKLNTSYENSIDGSWIKDGTITWNKLNSDIQNKILQDQDGVGNIVKLQNVVNISQSVNQVDIGIESYEANIDSMFVYRNGLLLAEGQDYEIINNSSIKKLGSGNWNEEPDTCEFVFVVLKSIAESEDIYGNNYATKEELGQLSNLQTNNKDNIVEAINELFQSANNGKELIADAIGEPLNAEDTFNAMSNDINGLLSTFKTNMMNNGVAVESGDKFKVLIDKIATLADNEGKGIQMATGTVKAISADTSEPLICSVSDFSFTPDLIFVWNSGAMRFMYNSLKSTTTSEYYYVTTANSELAASVVLDGTNTYVRKGEFALSADIPSYYGASTNCNWVAYGVGEEDTTLRDSLASILTDEGVSVTEEDDMASLITKTDKEFQDNTTILYNKMKDANFDVDPSMNMDALLEKLNFDFIVEGSLTGLGNSDTPGEIIFSKRNLNFTPSRVFATLTEVSESYDVGQSTYYNSITVNSGGKFVGTSEYNTIEIKIVDNGFDLILSSELSDDYNSLGWMAVNTVTYTAIR